MTTVTTAHSSKINCSHILYSSYDHDFIVSCKVYRGRKSNTEMTPGAFLISWMGIIVWPCTCVIVWRVTLLMWEADDDKLIGLDGQKIHNTQTAC